jgi:hypothetical protein
VAEKRALQILQTVSAVLLRNTHVSPSFSLVSLVIRLG